MHISDVSNVKVGSQLRVIETGSHGLTIGNIYTVTEVDEYGQFGQFCRCGSDQHAGWVHPHHVELVK